MPNFDLDVEVEDFFSSCDNYEKKELAELLIDDGFASPLKEAEVDYKSMGVQHDMYIKSLDNLKGSYFSLSLDDMEKVIELSKKYS